MHTLDLTYLSRVWLKRVHNSTIHIQIPPEWLGGSHIMQYRCGYCESKYPWGYCKSTLQLCAAALVTVASEYPHSTRQLAVATVVLVIWDLRSRSEKCGCVYGAPCTWWRNETLSTDLFFPAFYFPDWK